ncbi:MAG: hypothetical protein JST00_11560 [Deltaproteobacteria bacterium]|nr:hypothetical protein [Deltaproteobacteria bacterium]
MLSSLVSGIRMAKDDDDEIILPKKGKSGGKSASGGKKPSPQMRKLMRVTRIVGILFGGFVSLVGVMALVGLATDNFLIRLLAGLVIVVGLPAFLADRLLKRTNMGGGLGMVADVFAIILLGIALVLVAADAISKGLLAHEGDIYARKGSTAMARVVYFLAGVAPEFPAAGAAAAGSASGSASARASGSASSSGSK